MAVHHKLTSFTSWLTQKLGRAWATVLAIALVLIWLIGIPIVGLSDTYQLIINTTTTIITFIMVFVIQNTQNRDTTAIQAKLDMLLIKQGVKNPHKLKLEKKSDKEIEKELDKIVKKR